MILKRKGGIFHEAICINSRYSLCNILIAACSVTTNITTDHKNMNDKTLQTETATTPLKVEKDQKLL